MGPSVTRVLWLLVSSDWVRGGNVFQAESVQIFPGSFLITTFSDNLSSEVTELGCQGSWAIHQEENQDLDHSIRVPI